MPVYTVKFDDLDARVRELEAKGERLVNVVHSRPRSDTLLVITKPAPKVEHRFVPPRPEGIGHPESGSQGGGWLWKRLTR